MTEEELRNRTYDLVVCDSDSWLYKASYAGTKKEVSLYNEKGELQGVFTGIKKCRDYMKEVGDFLMIDTSGWYTEDTIEHLPVEHCYKVLDNYIANLKKKVKGKRWRFFIGRGELYRDQQATLYKYKGNREGVEKPYHFNAVKDYMESKHETTVVRMLEVDDVVSVFVCKDYKRNYQDPKQLLIAIDKDLDCSVGARYNPDKDKWYYIEQEEADYNFAIQTLTGDWSTDGIKGLPNVSDEFREKYKLSKRSGVGKATAQAILQDLKGESLQTLYGRVLEAYKSFYPNPYEYTSWDGKQLKATPEDVLDENCSLLFMMRNKDEMWKEYKERTFTNDTI